MQWEISSKVLIHLPFCCKISLYMSIEIWKEIHSGSLLSELNLSTDGVHHISLQQSTTELDRERFDLGS